MDYYYLCQWLSLWYQTNCSKFLDAYDQFTRLSLWQNFLERYKKRKYENQRVTRTLILIVTIASTLLSDLFCILFIVSTVECGTRALWIKVTDLDWWLFGWKYHSWLMNTFNSPVGTVQTDKQINVIVRTAYRIWPFCVHWSARETWLAMRRHNSC